MVKLLGKLLQKSATKLLVGFQGRGHSTEDVLEPSERGGQGADEQAAGRDARGEHTVIIKHHQTEKKGSEGDLEGNSWQHDEPPPGDLQSLLHPLLLHPGQH